MDPGLPGSIGGRNAEDSHSGIQAQLLPAFRISGNCNPSLSWSSAARTGTGTRTHASASAGPVANACTDAGASSYQTALSSSPRCPQGASEPHLRRLWGRLRSSMNDDAVTHAPPSGRPSTCQTPNQTPKQKQKQDSSWHLRLLQKGRPPQGETFSDLHRSHTAPPAPPGRLRDWSLSGRHGRSQAREEARYAPSAAKSQATVYTADLTLTVSAGQLQQSVTSVGRRDGLRRLSDGYITSTSANPLYQYHVAPELEGHDNPPPSRLGLMQRLLRALTGKSWSKGQGQVRCDGGGGAPAGGSGKRSRNTAATAASNSETCVVSCMVGSQRSGHRASRSCALLAAAAAGPSDESSTDDAEEALQLLRLQRRDSKVINCARMRLGPRPVCLMSSGGSCSCEGAIKVHLPGGAAEFPASAATAGTSGGTAAFGSEAMLGSLAPRASALLADRTSVSSPALLHSQLSPNPGLSASPVSRSFSPPQSPAAGTSPSAVATATATVTATDSAVTSPAAAGAAAFSHLGRVAASAGASPAWSLGNPQNTASPSSPMPPMTSSHLEAWSSCPESSPPVATAHPSSPQQQPQPQPPQQQGGAWGPLPSVPISRDRDRGELHVPRETKDKGSREKLQQLLPTSIANLRFRLAPLRRSAGDVGDSGETSQPHPSVQMSPDRAAIAGFPSSSSPPMGQPRDDEQSSLSEPVAVLASTRSMRRLAIGVDTVE
ncbi:hypothetical protein Vretimale_8623 [Volvox reticuliferus]|uniref:Uncharacterized protein n=1 Tax=Volvox reticuliferus TaxID=1737510 RepID=A0A8J4CD52_9CHLO|nr:hypothetical protein Vretifemale_6449 [Volvox reticuliferus]GIM03984.1 hypothetical protein Vretimale_8623 [Volvox reticuliferus]